MEEREERGLDFIDIGVHIQHGHGRDRRSLEDFEQGKRQPDFVDEMVAGYSKATGVPVATIAKRVCDRLRAESKALT